jgi:hypothetical protein
LAFLSQWVSIRLAFNGNDRLSWSVGKFNVENKKSPLFLSGNSGTP